jgi:Holliday junction resolvase RusA-like endonuclease
MSDMVKVEVEVNGQPKGKGRPRFTKQGRAYTPKETREYERRIQAAAWAAMKAAGLDVTDKSVVVRISAQMEIPASWPKIKKMEAEYNARHHNTKPDLDNIIKAVLDGISDPDSGPILLDDKQVHYVEARKVFCNPQRGPVLHFSVEWSK